MVARAWITPRKNDVTPSCGESVGKSITRSLDYQPKSSNGNQRKTESD